MVHADHLTCRQAALWEYLEALGPGDEVLSVPAQVQTASTAAHAAMKKESERVRLRDEHAARSTELHEVKARTAVLEQRFEDATVLAHQAVAGASERADAATQAAKHCARRLAEIEGSTSWRLTAPLRRLGRALRRKRA